MKILILGLSYKKNVDDLESASVKLMNYFNKAEIKLNENQNLEKFDIAILMTDHDVFNYKIVYEHSRNIIDCRGYSIDNKVTRA